ncbi:MAG: flagellar filament capping protein FliD [Oscillospiraceae bacterium]|jgi:flagellar hook-associated protein 2|nr:flagellar filament capping protein FliD [Oscillospiraceae bacterium]
MATVTNTTRITSLFSGMDTDALVKAMTMNQQSKVDSLNAKMKQAEWKKETLTDFNNKVRVFRDTYGSVLGEQNLMTKGAFVSFGVSMPENSGVSISALASAKAGGYSVRVDQIATASAMKGAKLTGRITGLTEAEINSTAVGALTALQGGAVSSGPIEFSINGESFSFSSSDSLKKIMDTVNKSAAGVTMSYSQTSDRITIVSNTMGAYDGSAENANKTITFTDGSGFLNNLGLTEVTNGQDAIVYFNGETEARSLDTNSITLDGVQFTFLRPTAGNVDYTLTADYKPAADRIKGFVEAYNTLIKELFTAYNQKPSRDYKPLTDDQRDALSEKEIEDWEKKAREGLLYRDNTLGKLVDGMRTLLTKTFGGSGNLASIGMTTGRYMIGEPAQIELDEEKLLKALQADPERVFSLMSGTEKDVSGGGGLMTQLNKLMDDYVGAIKSRDLQNLNTNIGDYTKRIKEQEDKLYAMSERYYLQYAKLEVALGQMQSQQSSMASLFGMGNTGQ